MTLAIILSAVAMTVIVGVRYLLVSGAFAWITVRKHPGLFLGLEDGVLGEGQKERERDHLNPLRRRSPP